MSVHIEQFEESTAIPIAIANQGPPAELGMRMAPGKSPGHLWRWPLIYHNVIDLILEKVTEMLNLFS